MNQEAQSQTTPQKWWKFGHVWLVVGGPAIVVLASFFTLYLAISRPDPVTDENYYQKGIDINKTLGGTPSSAAPAEVARNNAATGVPKPSNQP